LTHRQDLLAEAVSGGVACPDFDSGGPCLRLMPWPPHRYRGTVQQGDPLREVGAMAPADDNVRQGEQIACRSLGRSVSRTYWKSQLVLWLMTKICSSSDWSAIGSLPYEPQY
jgi:hypothetical protein